MSATAADLRHDAAARLGEIAGYDERLDLRLVLIRPSAIDVLYRQALRKAIGDELLLGEVRGLLEVAKGRTVPMIDAVHELGLPERTPTDRMTLDDLDRVIAQELA